MSKLMRAYDTRKLMMDPECQSCAFMDQWGMCGKECEEVIIQ